MPDCKQCGKPVQDSDRFCISCGHKLKVDAAEILRDVRGLPGAGEANVDRAGRNPERNLRVGDESTSVTTGDVFIGRGKQGEEYTPYCRGCGTFVAQDMSKRCPRCGAVPLCWRHFDEKAMACAVCSPEAFGVAATPAQHRASISPDVAAQPSGSPPQPLTPPVAKPIAPLTPQVVAPAVPLTPAVAASAAPREGAFAYAARMETIEKLGLGTTSDVSPLVRAEFAGLSPARQDLFLAEFSRARKKTAVAYVWWLILQTHYVYLGKWPLTLLMWVTGWLLVGIVWWIVDFFRVPGMVRAYNSALAAKILTTMRQVGA